MVSVSIIIINYNTADFTVKCINSLLKHTPKNLSFQYIIVDNASHKESFNKVNTYVNSLRDEIDICLLRSKINTGFGGGNMLGVQKAKGTYLAFVNNDVELENDCFTSLYKFMEENPQAGVCGPQAFNRNNELLPTIDHFASLPREFFGRKF
jgi:GT2 family glycosyltransferase